MEQPSCVIALITLLFELTESKMLYIGLTVFNFTIKNSETELT